jgi:hydroxymethylpyrimidine/phosphomethylpyrimidine kinase
VYAFDLVLLKKQKMPNERFTNDRAALADRHGFGYYLGAASAQGKLQEDDPVTTATQKAQRWIEKTAYNWSLHLTKSNVRPRGDAGK